MRSLAHMLFVLGLYLWSSCAAQVDDVSGFWNAMLTLPGASIRLEIDVVVADGQYSGVLRSPDQVGGERELSYLSLHGDSLVFEVSSLAFTFKGVLNRDNETISGDVTQMGMRFPLVFGREPLAPMRPERPQTPEAPFPYQVEEVRFVSADMAYHLAGTLTLPETPSRLGVVLVSGSGPQNRDSEMLHHRPFAVWADYLTRRGIAVLRYDERGIEASEGVFDDCTTFDLAADAAQARRFLAERLGSSAKTGIMGLSEGGLIAAIVAADDKHTDFIVSLAGPGVHSLEILHTQYIDIFVSQGVSRDDAEVGAERNRRLHALVLEAPDSTHAANALKAFHEREAAEQGVPFDGDAYTLIEGMLNTPWMRTFLSIDPRDYWSNVDCHVLAINGNRDLQVAANANLRAIGFALRRNKNSTFTTEVIPEHNHLFQRTSSGAVSEYGELTETVSEEVLEKVGNWLLRLVK